MFKLARLPSFSIYPVSHGGGAMQFSNCLNPALPTHLTALSWLLTTWPPPLPA